MTPKYMIGETLYYPLQNSIVKSRLSKIIIDKDCITYELSCGRKGTEKYVFKTFEEARQFCLDDERDKYLNAVRTIKEWQE